MSRLAVAEAFVDGCNRRSAGLTLRELREARELHLREVELATGINRGTLSKIERGIEMPVPSQIVALSELYGVPADAWRPVLEYRIPTEIAESTVQGGRS